MGNLSNYAEYDQALPAAKTVYVAAAVPITPVNTQVDIATFGTLKAGLYLFSATLNITQITNASVTTLKFLDGSTVMRGNEEGMAIGFVGVQSIPMFAYNLLNDAIVKLVAFSTVVTATVVDVVTNNGTGTTDLTSSISYVRLK